MSCEHVSQSASGQNSCPCYGAQMNVSRSLGTLSLLIVLIAVGCGPSPSSTAPSTTARAATPAAVQYTTVESAVQPAGSIRVELTSFAFKPADIPLTAGKVVLFLVNTSSEDHSMALRNPAVSVLAVVALSAHVKAGRSAVFTIDNLAVGDYTVSCPIGDHASSGMVATATVR